MANVNKFKQWFQDDCMDRVAAFNVESESEFPISRFDSVNGWCTPSTMKLINFAVTECLEGGEEYLEIGSYCGRSIIAALLNNNKRAQVIEPFDLFLEDGVFIQSLWDRNVNQFGVRDRITLHKIKCVEFNESLPPVGVLYYDGNHDSGHTYHSLRAFESYLADNAIILVDDYHAIGGPQRRRWPGWLPAYKPVKEDVDRWLMETENAKLIGIAPWINHQAVIIYKRG
jgi:predicted O-methyltransferase YrrM